ncbi:hypothetical protein H257_05747 [Aphanomyces astaci]|uniref:Reverse transcriptase n=1 Tax=Aphanomyces astaci TaxID=112090 RepID=W4GN91_APHAT|nr:hypothetical protein H257_05747 [Aphanomyces astaci]ETV81160.1 hypothetical protein H257_05747 [Aphanomyces astaci]|eukprot:XP_009829018.1 hypothetical protein H257_05747 [Aphanomyces astaci]
MNGDGANSTLSGCSTRDAHAFVLSACDQSELPLNAAKIPQLPEVSYLSFARVARGHDNISIALITESQEMNLLISSTTDDPVEEDVSHPSLSVWKDLETNPYYDLVREFQDSFPDSVPKCLPKDKGVRHNIDLVPGTKWCVTRQWRLPRDQVAYIDEFLQHASEPVTCGRASPRTLVPPCVLRKAAGNGALFTPTTS